MKTTARVLDIDTLRTFHAIARLHQFKAASSYLNKSPSAVSMHVRRLEELTGGYLFERDNQGVALTALGRTLLAKVVTLLDAHDEILGSLDVASVAGKVRFGIPDEYARPILRDVLQGFLMDHPRVELEIKIATSGELERDVAKGKLDLALVVSVDTGGAGMHETTVAFSQPVWVGAPGFRVTWDSPLPLALHGQGCPFRAAALDALSAAGLRWRALMIASGCSALEAAIEGGVAIGVLDQASVSPSMQIFGPKEGFPPLPAHRLAVIRQGDAPSEAGALFESVLLARFRP
jgi:DNA-binding transcriptional LysR family regulator